jgi:hypothetical protein
MSNRLVYGVGIYTKGKYKSWENGKPTKVYTAWTNMLKRCYSQISLEERPTYTGCTVCPEWLNFQKFAEWYFSNYYEVSSFGTLQIDKDILIKGNKIYSPETCVFVPSVINSLFIKHDAKRGDYPIGVTYNKKAKKYEARISYGDGRFHYLGLFDTVEEAFEVYKYHKELHIKNKAEEHKPNIPLKLYEAMLNYEVEITD